jgi:hypothetical protein
MLEIWHASAGWTTTAAGAREVYSAQLTAPFYCADDNQLRRSLAGSFIHLVPVSRFGGTCVMKTVSRKKKPLSLDAVLASVEIEMAQIVTAIAAERRSSAPTPRRPRVHHPKGHAHAA